MFGFWSKRFKDPFVHVDDPQKVIYKMCNQMSRCLLFEGLHYYTLIDAALLN